MNDNFLQLKDNQFKEEDVYSNAVFDDVEIVVDPELEDESTVDINNYLGKFILQCRICGNMFPSENMLNNETHCPICGEISTNGFIYKGKLLNKKINTNMSNDEQSAIDDLSTNNKYNQTNDLGNIVDSGTFEQFKK